MRVHVHVVVVATKVHLFPEVATCTVRVRIRTIHISGSTFNIRTKVRKYESTFVLSKVRKYFRTFEGSLSVYLSSYVV
jgi:hypothetical protein